MMGLSPQMVWFRNVLAGGLQDREASALEYYRMLEAYYMNNGLYDAVRLGLLHEGAAMPGMLSLRCPARRCVEFHVLHTWPGPLEKALPLLTANERIRPALKQVWSWSNWSVKKQLAVRWFALFGDWFCKVSAAPGSDGKRTRVFFQNIKPEMVTDFEQDERGNIRSIRLDIPVTGQRGGLTYHTELWDAQGMRVYLNPGGPAVEERRLPEPIRAEGLERFGIDFVPFVHASFMDMGEKRGVGVFTLALDKIDEANRMASRLHQLIFRYNKPTVAILANGADGSGRPLPPLRLQGTGLQGSDDEPQDEEIRSFPGNSRMEYLVPNLNYQAHLEAINAQMLELEQDLPELSYYRQQELGSSISGRAVRLMLSQAVQRTLEARGNLEAALVRADQMALTMGARAGLFGEIGSYEAGDFEHEFAEREVIPFTAQEQAETLLKERSAGVPLLTALRRRGWSETEIDLMRGELLANGSGGLTGGTG